MGKKRKIKEISDEERIQTILIRDPYGYCAPDTWDTQDRRRQDDGVYVAVEWLEFIFGGLDGPNSSMAARRRYVPAVEMVFKWTSRAELLVAIRRDISLTPQLGRHYYAEFLRNSPRGQEERRSSLIMRAKYESEDQILGKGEGWKQVSFPTIDMTSIRRHKFTEPYPSPGLPVVPPKLDPTLDVKEEKKDIKPQTMDVKPQVKPEPDSTAVKQEIKPEAPLEDVKPTIPNLSSGHGPKVEDETSSTFVKQEPNTLSLSIKQEPQGTNVKEEDVDEMIRRVQARREEDRRAAIGGTAANPNQQADLGLVFDHDDANQKSHNHQERLDDGHRPAKRVKKEEPQ